MTQGEDPSVVSGDKVEPIQPPLFLGAEARKQLISHGYALLSTKSRGFSEKFFTFRTKWGTIVAVQKLQHHAYVQAGDFGHEFRMEKGIQQPAIRELLWYARDQPLQFDSRGILLPHKTRFWRWQLHMDELPRDFKDSATQDFFKEVSYAI